jgi:hypothetical protein
MNFSIEEGFWALFPAVRIGVKITRDIDNRAAGDYAAMLLEEATVQKITSTMVTSQYAEGVAKHETCCLSPGFYRHSGFLSDR